MNRFTVLVASPEVRSIVRSAALRAADSVAARVSGVAGDVGPEPNIVDLAELGPALLAARPGGHVVDALDRVAGSDVLLVATPQAHGSYTGLLKVFLDRLPELGLGSAVAVPMAVVADLRNGRNTEDDLRVLLSDLGAWVIEPGLLLSEAELTESRGLIDAWADVAARSLSRALAVSA